MRDKCNEFDAASLFLLPYDSRNSEAASNER